MKKVSLAIAVAAVASLAVIGSAAAAITDQEGTTIANGKATLVSDDITAYSYISFDDLNGQPVEALTDLSADVVSGTGWGGGSPRFSVRVSGDGVDDKRIVVYLGNLPDLNTGNPGLTGNLLDSGARVDSTQTGGPFYGTWADAKAAADDAGYTTISNIALVVDGGWKASQTFVFDAVSINGAVHGFGADVTLPNPDAPHITPNTLIAEKATWRTDETSLEVGDKVHAYNLAATGFPEPTYTYVWQFCPAGGGACHAEPGDPNEANLLQIEPVNEGATLTLIATATNSEGSDSVTVAFGVIGPKYVAGPQGGSGNANGGNGNQHADLAPAPAPAPTPAPAPAPKDTIAPTKPASPVATVKGRQLQVSFGSSSDNVKVVGYRLYQGGKAIATIDGTSFKMPVGMIGEPGKIVLELRAFDAAGNLSEPVVLTLTRKAHPKAPKVKPAWAWKLARWQDTPASKRGDRPHTPNTLPAWHAKWNAWHKAPVKVTVG